MSGSVKWSWVTKTYLENNANLGLAPPVVATNARSMWLSPSLSIPRITVQEPVEVEMMEQREAECARVPVCGRPLKKGAGMGENLA